MVLNEAIAEAIDEIHTLETAVDILDGGNDGVQGREWFGGAGFVLVLMVIVCLDVFMLSLCFYFLWNIVVYVF